MEASSRNDTEDASGFIHSSGGSLHFARRSPKASHVRHLSPTGHRLRHRPKRADARRNYEKLVAAAAEAFAENGTAASLEEIARRADVGIGTLYRHFPTRQDLLEAVYVDDVEAMSRKAYDLDDSTPWEALVTWLHQFLRYAATKHALADEMMKTTDAEAPVFRLLPRGDHRRRRHAAGARPGGRRRAAGRQLHRRRSDGRRHRHDPLGRPGADRPHPRCRA